MKDKNITIEDEAAKELAEITPAKAPKGISEAAIAEKTKVGLTREQAIEVINNQAAHDAELAKSSAKESKAKLQPNFLPRRGPSSPERNTKTNRKPIDQ